MRTRGNGDVRTTPKAMAPVANAIVAASMFSKAGPGRPRGYVLRCVPSSPSHEPVELKTRAYPAYCTTREVSATPNSSSQQEPTPLCRGPSEIDGRMSWGSA